MCKDILISNFPGNQLEVKHPATSFVCGYICPNRTMQILRLQVFCWTSSFILNETNPCDRFSCESAKQWSCLFLKERLYFCELALFLSSEFLINECRIVFGCWKPSLCMGLNKQRTANNTNLNSYWFLSLFKKGLFFPHPELQVW